MNYYLDVLKKYVVFSGRARRKEYWMFALFNLIIALILLVVGTVIHTQLLYYIYVLLVLIPSLAVAVRRLHDIGQSGWWFLIAIVPLIGPIILLFLFIRDSDPGENKYGPNPKGIVAVPTTI